MDDPKLDLASARDAYLPPRQKEHPQGRWGGARWIPDVLSTLTTDGSLSPHISLKSKQTIKRRKRGKKKIFLQSIAFPLHSPLPKKEISFGQIQDTVFLKGMSSLGDQLLHCSNK